MNLTCKDALALRPARKMASLAQVAILIFLMVGSWSDQEPLFRAVRKGLSCGGRKAFPYSREPRACLLAQAHATVDFFDLITPCQTECR